MLAGKTVSTSAPNAIIARRGGIPGSGGRPPFARVRNLPVRQKTGGLSPPSSPQKKSGQCKHKERAASGADRSAGLPEVANPAAHGEENCEAGQPRIEDRPRLDGPIGIDWDEPQRHESHAPADAALPSGGKARLRKTSAGMMRSRIAGMCRKGSSGRS
jgi:hypothetical protein